MRSSLHPRVEVYREKSQRESETEAIAPTLQSRDLLPLLFLSRDPLQKFQAAVSKQLNAVALRSTRDKRATGKEKRDRIERNEFKPRRFS